jgi:hypothetical protein
VWVDRREARLLKLYREQGFVNAGRLFSDAQVDELCGELERVIAQGDHVVRRPLLLRNIGLPAAPVWQIVNIWQASDAFRALLNNQPLLSLAALLSGARELRLWHDQIQYKPIENGGVNMWHQDAPYWPVLTPNDAQITAWIALDRADESNGCMSMVPGSHRWGNQIDRLHSLNGFHDLPHELEGNPVRAQLCVVGRGEVHFHHSLTWHGSHGNQSHRPRRAIALHFMTERTCFQAAGDHVMKPFMTIPDQAPVQGPAFPLLFTQPAF